MSLNIGCAARPGRSQDNKTGSWRVFKPEFHYDLCTNCGTCQLLCPEGCIHKIDDNYIPDYSFCKGCGMCAEQCPAEAIVMIQEEK